MNRDLIVDIARSQLDDRGIESFSMRSLASEIGVSPMAIYRHVGDRDSLLGLVLDDVSALFPAIELPADPHDRIVTLLCAVFDVLASKRWIADVLRAGSPGGSGALWLVDRILAAAKELGLDDSAALTMYRALWTHTLGAVLNAPTAEIQAATTERIERKVAGLGADGFPHLVAALRTVPAADPKAAYRRAIGCLIEGYTSGYPPSPT